MAQICEICGIASTHPMEFKADDGVHVLCETDFDRFVDATGTRYGDSTCPYICPRYKESIRTGSCLRNWKSCPNI